MRERFDLRSLGLPAIAAPMAGGPTTPELAAAVAGAGGLGVLAGGYRRAEELEGLLRAARRLGPGPLGVNLFVPGADDADPAALAEYGARLRPEFEEHGVEPGEARWDDDDWAAKLELVADERPEVVSFTFGLPDAAIVRDLGGAGITVLATITEVEDALAAARAGVHGLVVQGPKAGGHRGTFSAGAEPGTASLASLLDALLAEPELTGLSIVAAGGIASAEVVSAALARGAAAVQLGTALLRSEEAGTSETHRAALAGGEFERTEVTRAFSGRPARGLFNGFLGRHSAHAPAAYPQVHHLTAPLRADAVRRGDAHGTSLWAGTGFASAEDGPAARILTGLAGPDALAEARG